MEKRKRGRPKKGQEKTEKKYFSVSDVSRETGITPQAIKYFAQHGKIISIRTIGGHIRIPRSEFEKIIYLYNLDKIK